MAGLTGKWAKAFIIIFIIQSVWSCSTLIRIPEANKVIEFSGREWLVKSNMHPKGPGPNYYSDDPEQVWVDDNGWLHLTIRKVGDKWSCSEVISVDRFSYGTYSFQLASRIDQLDPQVVIGLFTWKPGAFYHNREVDIEFAKWGDPQADNGQFALQPADYQGNIYRFNFELEGDYTSHEFTWGKGYIFFDSTHGHLSNQLPRRGIAHWMKSNWFSRAKNLQVRMNCWLFDGMPPLNQEEVEIIIKNFSYQPLK